jgi:hypothetical protein
MMDDTSAHVTHELARSLLEWFNAVAPGTAMRIDNMTANQAQSIVAEVATIAVDMNVSLDGLYVLGPEDSGINVSVARATELRNNEDQRRGKLVLLVPHGVLSKGQES